MKTMRARASAGVAVVLLATACGGAQYEKAPAASPASGAPPETPTAAPPPPSSEPMHTAPSDVQAAPAPAASPAGRAGAASETAPESADRERGGSRQAALARDRADIDVAERMLAAAAGDCAAACRALGSMDRAAGHLCALAASSDERDRCDDARARLRAARDRVLRTCGSCPGGPSLDRNAPVPSR